MKVSVITPVYNTAKTLETTILSVLNQSIPAEYLVMDGGSTDGSIAIAERYADRLTLVSEPDRGVYDAMNKGIVRSTGDVIGIINADDWYNENALQSIVSIFTSNPDVDLVYSPIDNYFDGRYRSTYTPGKLENLHFKFTLNHPSCFVRRSVYEQIGLYDLKYAIAADYDFVFRAYCGGYRFHYFTSPLASYSLEGMSSQPANRLQLIRESWRVGAANAASTRLRLQRTVFYTNWLLKDVLMHPVKQRVKPQTIGKIKTFVREKLGAFPADEFGAW
jgi:glycosyltransferase involved in cell wall biosynthesis